MIRVDLPPDPLAGVRQLALRVTAALGALGETHEVGFELPDAGRAPPRTVRVRQGAAPAQPTVAQVVRWFAFGTDDGRLVARNFFEVNGALREAIGTDLIERFLADAIEGRVPNRGALNLALAHRVKAFVVRRWETGGGDLYVAPLSAGHARRKARLGYPGAPGRMTGQSLDAVRSARPIARRAR